MPLSLSLSLSHTLSLLHTLSLSLPSFLRMPFRHSCDRPIVSFEKTRSAAFRLSWTWVCADADAAVGLLGCWACRRPRGLKTNLWSIRRSVSSRAESVLGLFVVLACLLWPKNRPIQEGGSKCSDLYLLLLRNAFNKISLSLSLFLVSKLRLFKSIYCDLFLR